MTKFPHHAAYHPSSTELAQAALLTVWSSLARYHEDLVLVGGLAVRLITKPSNVDHLPAAVTNDVDLGIALGATGGSYGTITAELQGLGFKFDGARFCRVINDLPIFIDFLTEHPAATKGTVMVDDVPTSIFLGIDRALAHSRRVRLSGADLYGAVHSYEIPVAEIGPLLVLKCNAFGGRKQPKDAYDVLFAALRYHEGSDAAVRGFRAEADLGNRGFAAARETLARDFTQSDHGGPLRAAAFALGPRRQDADYRDQHRRIVEDVVTLGRLLAG